MGYYAKLKRYGIRGCSLGWCRSYFMNRKYVCAINGKLSDEKHIHVGVPQGSNLGPFFCIYINDLPNCLETTNAKLLADDTTLSG